MLQTNSLCVSLGDSIGCNQANKGVLRIGDDRRSTNEVCAQIRYPSGDAVQHLSEVVSILTSKCPGDVMASHKWRVADKCTKAALVHDFREYERPVKGSSSVQLFISEMAKCFRSLLPVG